MQKRTKYLNWDDYFMGIAMLSAQRSKDPDTQVGACIVNQNNIILGTGYNGLLKGTKDDEINWSRDNVDIKDTKYPYVIHAEQNAIINSNQNNLQGARIYVTLFPCSNCAKNIIQNGITSVYYMDDKYNQEPDGQMAIKLFKMAKIEIILLKPKLIIQF